MDESTIGSRVKRAWNAFLNKDPTSSIRYIEGGSAYKPDRRRPIRGNERSIVNAVYNRIAMDVAAIKILHVRLDKNEQFMGVVDSGLNNCLTLEANIDQTGRALVQDTVQSMLDEGVVALVPVDTDVDPNDTESFKVITMRTGRVTQWYPTKVKVEVYNEAKGKREEVIVSKRMVSIIENPLYSVMNEPNSTSQRLIRKLNLLDVIDEQSGAGKLDLIIQLPYVIKTEARRQQAEIRRKDIENQLSGSKYGIAYIPLNNYNYIYPYVNLNDNELAKIYTSSNILEKTFLMIPYRLTITIDKNMPAGGKTTFDSVNVLTETIDLRPSNNILLTSITNLSDLTLSVSRKNIGNGIYTIDQSKMYDVKGLVEGFAEFKGYFGRYNRYGVFEFVKINQNFGLYPADNLYPMDKLLGRSSSTHLAYRGYYMNAVYDDEPTKYYSKVYTLFTNTSGVETYLEKEIDNGYLNNNHKEYQYYSLDDNFLIKNCKFTNDQINTILGQIAESLKYISYIPAEIESLGLPYIETGDVIRVITHDNGFETIILSRNLSGEQLLFDNYQSRG